MVTLTHGGIDISGGAITGSSARIEAMVNDFDLGSGVPLTNALRLLFRDGSAVTGSDTDNRALKYTAEIKADTWADVTAAEAALHQVVNAARSVFTIVPTTGAPTSVLDVFRGRMSPRFDAGWNQALECFIARYDIEAPAWPWVRAADLTTQVLAPTHAPPTVVDDCSAVTNWSVAVAAGTSGTPTRTAETLSGESVIHATWLIADPGYAYVQQNLIYSGTKPTTDLVGLEVYAPTTSGFEGGIQLNFERPSSSESVVHGAYTYTRYWFPNPGGTDPWYFTLSFNWAVGLGGEAYFAGLLSADEPGIGGVLAVETVGSVRSTGSVTCARASDPIESLFVYADPQLGAFSPRLAATWSAGRDGTYVVYSSDAHLEGDVVTATFTDTAGRAVSTLPTRIDAEVAAMTWKPIGQVQLGGFQSGLIGAQTVTGVDSTKLRLFRLAEDTTLVYLDGISGEEVVIQAPSVDYPNGGIWADGVAVEAACPGFPMIAVPSTSVFVEANDSDTSPVTSTLAYYAYALIYTGA